MSSRTSTRQPDRGSALVLTLVLVVVIGATVVGVAGYSTTSLTYGRVAEARSNRLAAADAGMRYALDQIKLRARGCVWDDAVHTLPGITSDFNGATADVECQRISSGLDDIQLYAAVMTGAGVPNSGSDAFLLKSQGGSLKKVLGGPVYMERIDADAFDFDSAASSAGVKIENGPLLYFDPAPGCVPVAPSVVVGRANGKLEFAPDLVYGPECLNQSWQQKFPSPYITRDLGLSTVRDGTTTVAVSSIDIGSVTAAFLTAAAGSPSPGSHFDITGAGGCRVFVPGRYTTPPATNGHDAYFLSGDYVFDLPAGDATLRARQGVITAGKINPSVPGSINERANTTACLTAQNLDPAIDGEGATFYFAGNSHIRIETNGALEIHARQQGPSFVSVQTLCRTKGNGGSDWCRDAGPLGFGGDGGLGTPKRSTLNATTTAEILYTNSGNGKEFIAHALFYAPLAEAEFGNVSNSAIQKMLGGIAVARLILQAATSATNFEIAVPTSPITGRIQVRSTAVGGGSVGATSIQAVIQYRPYESDADDRIRINSWRVCEDDVCS